MVNTNAYTVRPYEPGDRAVVLGLYEDVFGRTDEDWFDWRYSDNPYVSGTPIAVAEHDGEVVAARPSLALPLTIGDESVTAIVQVDPMVRSDHRGQGVFTQMVRYVYDHYASREPQISIGFANEAVTRALLNIDEELSIHVGLVTPFVTEYRIQRPGSLASTVTDRRSLRTLGWLATPFARAYLAVRERGVTAAVEDVTVRRRAATPVAALSRLADASPTGRVHATRDEAFYGWRFANPRFEYTTYVARRNGEPLAAVVVGRERDDGQVLHLSEVLPVEPPADCSVLARVLTTVFADNRDAAAVVTAGPAIPAELRADLGFVPKTRRPLSMLSPETTLVARPLTNERITEWRYGDWNLSNPDSWALSMCEREIG